MQQDYYETLGVRRGTSSKEIRDAYRRLARRYHPDVNPGDAESEEQFKRINEAHEVLSDEERRADYDEFGEKWRHAEQIRQAQQHGGFRFESGGFAGGRGPHVGGLGDILSRFGFRDGGGSEGVRRARASQEVAVDITLEEAYSGTIRNVSYSRDEACPSCGGAGYRDGGTCGTCHGAGYVRSPVRLEVKIPAGIDDGGRIRLRPDSETEISLRVRVRPDRRFERKGPDLHSEVRVPYTDAILGGEVEVPTMNGRVALTIPPGTQNGKTFRLVGKGMPRMGGGPHGTLFAKLAADLPTDLSDEERELFEKLREMGLEGRESV